MRNIYTTVVFFILALSVHSQIIVLQPDASAGIDTYVSSYNDTVNYGSNPYLFMAGSTAPQNDTLNLYIKFDLSAITPGTTINNVRIDFYSYGQNGGMQGYDLGTYEVLGSWKEDSLTWRNQPPHDNVNLWTIFGDYFQWNGGYSWRSLTIPASLVQKWVDNPSQNHGIMITQLNGFYGVPYIPSSDWADARYRPRIVLNSNGSKISGTVTDSLSNIIPGVILTANNLLNTQVFARDTADANGNYELNVIYPDTFMVTVEGITGVMPVIYDSIVVTEGQNYILNPMVDVNSHAIAGVQTSTWTLAQSPYIISGNITVPDDEQLIIEPGVIVKYAGSFEIAVYGSLQAVGNETDSIIFTSYDTITRHKGRGLRFYGADSCMLEYCRIENMRSFDRIWGQLDIDRGGGIYDYMSNLTVQHCFIRRNFAQTGGGICVLSYSPYFCIIDHNRIEDNIAYMDGCSYDGGAGVCIYADPNKETVGFHDNLILNNDFIDASCYNYEGGGGMIIVGGKFNIINNTFLYNSSKRGPAIYAPSFEGKMQNNIFWFNHDGYNNEQVAMEDQMGPLFESSYNCYPDSGVIFQYWNNPLPDTVPGGNNIIAYPVFADTVAGHYWLGSLSPCIDKGYNKLLRSQYDFKNVCRVFDGDNNGTGIVDIGAYEYNAHAFHYLDIGPDRELCYDTANTISVDPVYPHYSWSTGDTVNYTHVMSSDIFYVTVNENHGCYAFDSVSVIVNPLPVVYLGNDTALCYGNSFNLDAGPGYTNYMWNDTLFGSQYYETGISGGDYFVQITDNNNCSNHSDTVHVTINPLPVVDIGNDTTILIVTSGYVFLDAGSGYADYEWSTGDTTQQITLTASSLGVGMHSINITVTDTNGCIGYDMINITVVSGAGIEEELSGDMSIYPNPTEGSFVITTSGNLQEKYIEIFDPKGGKVFEKNLLNASENKIDLSGYPEGIYLIKITTDSGVIKKKLVID